MVSSKSFSTSVELRSTENINNNGPTERRSANYKPNIWDFEFIQNLKNDHKDEVYLRKVTDLKGKVRHLMDHMMDDNNKGPLTLLELIDDIQRLGLRYIFEKEIQVKLDYLKEKNINMNESLHTTALYFRLLRQNGFNISQDVFKVFKGAHADFSNDLSQDIKGLLSLYEASYLSTEGEGILDEAKAFATKHLKDMNNKIDDKNLNQLVNHALKLPLNIRMVRLEAKWYIDFYSERNDTNQSLLELAKLDYNKVQAGYQTDLINLSRWWKNLGLSKKMPFSRDRVVENFLLVAGMLSDPNYNYCREIITKVCLLITAIDDFYDVYATLDEAKLFTDAVERWDVNAMEQLPDYMRLCYLALFNTINEVAYDTLKEQDVNILPCLRKMWVDLCKSYFDEAKWFHTKYEPTLDEYLKKSWVSFGGPIVLGHTYFSLRPRITKESLDYLENDPDLIHWPSMILRLTDDMGTSTAELERGDNLKSIQCYMRDKDVSEDVAREYIRHLTDEAWKKLNAALWNNNCPLQQALAQSALNCARSGETFYQDGDGLGVPDHETKGRVLSMFVNGIPIMD
nr:terpene synthase 8 [Aquilegia oxysepala]